MSNSAKAKRRKRSCYLPDSVVDYLEAQSERLGVSANWLVSWSILRNRASISAIPSSDDLIRDLGQWAGPPAAQSH